MDSPAKGYGHMGAKINLNSSETPATLENPKPPRKPRKKVSQRKRVKRPKQRGKHKVKQEENTPTFVVKALELLECSFSDDKDQDEYLQELPTSVESPTAGLSRSDCPNYIPEGFKEYLQEFPVSIEYPRPGPEYHVPRELSASGSGHYYAEEPSTSSTVPSSLTPHPQMQSILAREDASELPTIKTEDTPDGADLCHTFCTEEFSTDVSDDPTSTSPPMAMADNPPFVSNEFSPPTSVIVKTVDKFKVSLPPLWIPIGGKKGLHLYRLSPKVPSAIQREIFIPYDGEAQIFVHCKPLLFAADLLNSFDCPRLRLDDDDNCIDKFCSWGVSIAKTLEQYAVCMGADMLEYKEVWENVQNSHIDKNAYQEGRYSETCRSNSCPVLIGLGKGKRCSSCTKILRLLRKRKQSLSKTPHPHTPNIYLSYKQLIEKLRIQHDEIRKKDNRIAYLS